MPEAPSEPPQVQMFARLDAPAPLPGLKLTCQLGPDTHDEGPDYPVIVWGECTFWPLSYEDNRLALCIVAYDAAGHVCGHWEVSGLRYIVRVTVEPATKSIVLVGQGSNSASVLWSTIAVDPPPVPQPFWLLSSPTGQALEAPATAGPVRLATRAAGASQLWLVDETNSSVTSVSAESKLALEGFASIGSELSVASTNLSVPGQRCTVDGDGALVGTVSQLVASAQGNGTVTIGPRSSPAPPQQQWYVLPYRAAPDLLSDQFPDLMPGQPFMLCDAEQRLLAVEVSGAQAKVVLVEAGSVEEALTLWSYEPGGMLLSQRTGLALTEADGTAVVLQPYDTYPQHWSLTAEGFLVCQESKQLLKASAGALQMKDYDPLEPPNQRWALQLRKPSTHVARFGDFPTPPDNVTSLTLTATVADDWFAGTSDRISVALGLSSFLQLLFDAPSRGQSRTITIDLQAMFGSSRINIGDITHVAIYQEPAPHPVASDAWKLASILLKANGEYTNYGFQRINKWLDNPALSLDPVWLGIVPWAAWLDSSQKPFDLDCATYSVGLKPWLGDIKSWRSYDPSTIDGIGQLIGMREGKLIGEQLKTRVCEELRATDQTHTYVWVFTPSGSILYWWWDHNDRDSYVRHSQLGSGDPVICAGEMEIRKLQNGPDDVGTVIGMVNDASGHYKPDGGACLWNLAKKLQELGVPTDTIEWRWRE